MSAYPSGANVYTQGFGSYPENVEIPHIDVRDPVSTDYKFPLGKRWVNRIDDTEFVLTSFTASLNITSAVWIQSAGGVSGVQTLTGDTGGAVSPTAGNINILGEETVQVTGDPGTSTLTISASTGGFPITPFVVGPEGEAGYQTIQSALTAIGAASGLVYVQPGTYTENLVFVAGSNVTIAGFTRDGTTIVGVHTPPTSGFANFLGLKLSSATHIFSSVAAGTAQLTIESVVVSCTNGFTFNLPNWTGTVQSFHSVHGGAANGFLNNLTGSSLLLANDSDLGSGTGQVMRTAGVSNIEQVAVGCPWTSEQDITAFNVSFSQTLTLADGGAFDFNCCNWSTDTSAALNITVASPVNIANSTINSTNNPVIDGTGGTVTLTDCVFVQGKNLSGSLTLANGISRGGSYITQFTVGPAPDAQFRTVQAAVTALGANSGVIFLQPGTYTENVNFLNNSNVEVVSLNPYAATLTGQHTPGANGAFSLVGLTLTSATNIFFNADSGSSRLTIDTCRVTITSGYAMAVSLWEGPLQIFNSTVAGSINGVIANGSGTSPLFISNSTVGAGSVLQMQIGEGSVSISHSSVNCPAFTGSGPTVAVYSSVVFTNTVSIGPAASVSFYNCTWATGANEAIDFQSSGISVSVFNSLINASANPCIAGSTGTLIAANLAFEDNSIIAAGVTLSSQSKNLIGGAMFLSGTGAPGMTAPQGSLYMRLDGSGIADRAYVNTDGATAWTNFVTAT